jgi:hypothetical protein
MTNHAQLPDAGHVPHWQIDDAVTKLKEAIEHAPLSITGARDTPEEAFANLLTALATLGLITDNTTTS